MTHSYSLVKSPPAIDNPTSSFIDQNPDANFYKSIPIKQADFGLESTPSAVPLNQDIEQHTDIKSSEVPVKPYNNEQGKQS